MLLLILGATVTSTVALCLDILEFYHYTWAVMTAGTKDDKLHA